jgi:Ca2+-binding RTX toxin-like protein
MDWQDVLARIDYYDNYPSRTPVPIVGGDDDDVIVGTEGPDGINSGFGNDTVDGAGGNDLVINSAGNDSVLGGAGDDVLLAGTGNDVLNGGEDFDVVWLHPGGNQVVNLAAGVALGPESGTDTLVSIEGAIGAYGFAFGNTLIGNALDNLLLGGSASGDYLHGGDGADILWGVDGRDHIIGGRGGDFIVAQGGAVIQGDLYGGPDDPGDWVIYARAGEAVTVDLQLGRGYVGAMSSSSDTLINIENVVGTPQGSDRLVGDNDANILLGLDGDNILEGNGGDDVLVAGAGQDALSGGAGNDRLEGHAGADALSGGDGDDMLIGAAAADILVGGAGNDTLDGGSHQDVLNGGDGDDVLSGGTSLDHLTGGAGRDQFVFVNGEVRGDQVLDFTAADDVVVVSGFVQLASFGDLQGHLFQVGDDVLVKFDADDSALLHGTTVASLTAGNFLFA